MLVPMAKIINLFHTSKGCADFPHFLFKQSEYLKCLEFQKKSLNLQRSSEAISVSPLR